MPIIHGLTGVADGALILIQLQLTRIDAASRCQQKKVIPSPAIVSALIDTGAESTCVDTAVVLRLALDAKKIVTTNAAALTGLGFNWVYDVELTVPHRNASSSQYLSIPELQVIELDLNGRGCEAILGRDVLSHCVLIYDGVAGSYSLGH